MMFSSVFIGFLTFVTSLVYFVMKVKGIYFPTGYVSLFIALLISITINTLFIGVLGQYMLRIYNIVRALPVSLIEESVNDDQS